MSDPEQIDDPITVLARTLSDAILSGDRALLSLIKALMEKVELLEARVEELEFPRGTHSDKVQ